MYILRTLTFVALMCGIASLSWGQSVTLRVEDAVIDEGTISVSVPIFFDNSDLGPIRSMQIQLLFDTDDLLFKRANKVSSRLSRFVVRADAEILRAETGTFGLGIDIFAIGGRTISAGADIIISLDFDIIEGATLPSQLSFLPFDGVASGTKGVIDADSGFPDDQHPMILEDGAIKLNAPAIGVSPDSLDFGDVLVGSKKSMTLRIFSVGALELSLGNISLSGSGFSASGGNALVAVGDSSDVVVEFEPSGVGISLGSLTIVSDAVNDPNLVVALRGEGVGADIDAAPDSLDFGSVPLLDSLDMALAVRNAGVGVDLVLNSVSVSGPGFELISVSSSVVAAGDSSQIVVRFRPDSLGTASGVLSIESNDQDESSLIISLKGTGTGEPDVSLFPDSLNFEGIGVKDSTLDTLFIRNKGNIKLKVDTVGVSSGDSSFSVSELVFPAIVDVTDSLSVIVYFSPQAAGSFLDSLFVISDDPDSDTLWVLVSGVGLIISSISLSQETIDFGNVPLGRADERSLGIRNVGDNVLSLDIVHITGPFEVVSPAFPQVLKADVRIIATFRFEPSNLGFVTGGLSLETDDPDQSPVEIRLRGRGIESAPTVIAPFGDFDYDCDIDLEDFVFFVGVFGTSSPIDSIGDKSANWDPRFDLDSDGNVGLSDFVVFLDNFGREC